MPPDLVLGGPGQPHRAPRHPGGSHPRTPVAPRSTTPKGSASTARHGPVPPSGQRTGTSLSPPRRATCTQPRCPLAWPPPTLVCAAGCPLRCGPRATRRPCRDARRPARTAVGPSGRRLRAERSACPRHVAPEARVARTVDLDQVEHPVEVEVGRHRSAAAAEADQPRLPGALDECAVLLREQQVARVLGCVVGLRVDVALRHVEVGSAIHVGVGELRVPGRRGQRGVAEERPVRGDAARSPRPRTPAARRPPRDAAACCRPGWTRTPRAARRRRHQTSRCPCPDAQGHPAVGLGVELRGLPGSTRQSCSPPSRV